MEGLKRGVSTLLGGPVSAGIARSANSLKSGGVGRPTEIGEEALRKRVLAAPQAQPRDGRDGGGRIGRGRSKLLRSIQWFHPRGAPSASYPVGTDTSGLGTVLEKESEGRGKEGKNGESGGEKRSEHGGIGQRGREKKDRWVDCSFQEGGEASR